MKAAVYDQYGSPEVLQLKDVEKPEPKENEVLVKVYATTVTSGDVRLRASDFPALFWLPARLIFGLFKPKKKILGHEFSGVVEAIGESISKFKIGDQVFGTTTMIKAGSYAEYVCLPEQWNHGVLALKPTNLNYKESAALPIGGMTALFLLEKAAVSKGKKILIYGASGSVGSYAVQIAKCYDTEVTAVCSSSKIEMVKSLGSDHIIDYTKEDYSSLERNYDIVFDAVGKTKKSLAKKVLSKEGVFVSIRVMTKEKDEHLLKLKEWAESKRIVPFIDKCYTLNKIVEAHQYVDQGHKSGNVVISVDES